MQTPVCVPRPFKRGRGLRDDGLVLVPAALSALVTAFLCLLECLPWLHSSPLVRLLPLPLRPHGTQRVPVLDAPLVCFPNFESRTQPRHGRTPLLGPPGQWFGRLYPPVLALQSAPPLVGPLPLPSRPRGTQLALHLGSFCVLVSRGPSLGRIGPPAPVSCGLLSGASPSWMLWTHTSVAHRCGLP